MLGKAGIMKAAPELYMRDQRCCERLEGGLVRLRLDGEGGDVRDDHEVRGWRRQRCCRCRCWTAWSARRGERQRRRRARVRC